jgi:hypothetical protein
VAPVVMPIISQLLRTSALVSMRVSPVVTFTRCYMRGLTQLSQTGFRCYYAVQPLCANSGLAALRPRMMEADADLWQ